MLRAQAAVEYGLRASGSALSSNGSGGPLHLGVCRLDVTFFNCAHRFYPRVTLAVFLVCVLVLVALAFRAKQVR